MQNTEKKSYFELFKEKFSGNDNYGRPKKDYIQKLYLMGIKELSEETKRMIWLSAYVSNNPRSDYHWQCDACYGVCEERKEGLYEKLHKKVVVENT